MSGANGLLSATVAVAPSFFSSVWDVAQSKCSEQQNFAPDPDLVKQEPATELTCFQEFFCLLQQLVILLALLVLILQEIFSAQATRFRPICLQV